MVWSRLINAIRYCPLCAEHIHLLQALKWTGIIKINLPPSLFLSEKKYGMMALFFLSCSFILVALLHSQWYQLTQKNAIRFPFSSILFISSKFSLSLSTSRSANAHSLQVRSLMCRALAIFPALPFRLFLFFNFIFRIHNDIYKLPIIIFHFIWQFRWQWFVSMRVLLVLCCSWLFVPHSNL